MSEGIISGGRPAEEETTRIAEARGADLSC
jgi:hypothetical protein